jgi:hypothetical protein
MQYFPEKDYDLPNIDLLSLIFGMRAVYVLLSSN